MNFVLPATLILDWWDELLRVAGSLKLGWVTASLVIANNGHLRYRRGEALAHQASCLNLVTNAVMVWNTVYMAAAVEQLTAFSGGVGLQVDQEEKQLICWRRQRTVLIGRVPPGGAWFSIEEESAQ